MRIVLAGCDFSMAQFNFKLSKTVANLIVEMESSGWNPDILSHNTQSLHGRVTTVPDFAVSEEKEKEARDGRR